MILERLRKCSAEHEDEIFTRLFRYLLRDDVYIAAYQNLYFNKGAMTKGTDNDTADGFGLDYIHELIEDLRNGTYQAKPVRRVYIPKKSGKLRPLGVPSFKDKLLQEAIRMYLEAIYEPLFDNCSHGFRPYRSCHTAFAYIKKTFTGVPWFIEGDISRCFDDIDHDILMNILGRKIKDDRFLQIIRKFLKAGYIDDWRYNETYSGVPQGGIISPIMCSIYMNEFDKKMREIASEFEKRSPEKSVYRNKEYCRISGKLERLRLRISKADKEQRIPLLKEEKALLKKLRILPERINMSKKIVYVRYADDWICGVFGSKQDCLEIKAEIAKFLKEELKLTLSEEKTLITHSDQKIRFLGYDISISRSQRLRKTRNGVVRRSIYKRVGLTAPLQDKIMAFLWNKKVIKQSKDGKVRPTSRPELLGASDEDIVRTYNSEMRGILNYYNMAGNFSKLYYFHYLMEYSCLFTLARKHNTSVRKIRDKYRFGKSWAVPYKTKAGIKRIGIVTMDSCKNHRKCEDQIHEYKPIKKKELWKRIEKNECECCGTKSEVPCKVFTVRRLKDLGNEPWAELMRAMRRKTLVVCPACYNLIHSSHGIKCKIDGEPDALRDARPVRGRALGDLQKLMFISFCKAPSAYSINLLGNNPWL